MAYVQSKGAHKPRRGVVGRPGDVIDICAGPGGMDMGARILGLPGMVGVELDKHACATGRAAGFRREQVDMRDLAPKRHRGVRGAVITPPCPTFSASGLRSGLGDDMQEAADAITCLGMGPNDRGQVGGCGCMWSDLPQHVTDLRTALVVEPARWALMAPDLEWLVAEQVPGVEPLWEDICGEMYGAGWEWVDVINLEATDYGAASRRRRTFLVGRRYRSPRVSVHDAGWNGADLPKTTMAQALGWGLGVKVWTRGDRKTSGGNGFSADGPSWCLTGSSRSWQIGEVGGPVMSIGEAGLLNGFPRDYPWQGSRTRQFLQAADVVNPVIAAVVLGVATDTPWVEPVKAYLEQLYPAAQRADALDAADMDVLRRLLDAVPVAA